MTKALYPLGKWLSNVAVITAMTLAIIAASALLQFIRADDLHLDLWALASPFLIVLFPALTAIAATAVLFDCIPLLRGGLGNVLFFFIAYPILTISLDLPGNTILYPSIYAACATLFTWVYNNTSGSLLLSLLFHTSINVTGLFLASAKIHPLVNLALVWGIVALIVSRFGPARLSCKTAGD